MDAANLVVRLDSEPGVAGTELAEEKMRQTNQQVLQDLCGEGWSVRPIDAANGVFELTLPAVRYSMPMGVVSIPAPLFRAQVRDSDKTVGNYQERLIADIVLQNGDKMLGVELGFPFSSKFTISAAGWARCRVGREPGSVRCQALVEMGLQVPKASWPSMPSESPAELLSIDPMLRVGAGDMEKSQGPSQRLAETGATILIGHVRRLLLRSVRACRRFGARNNRFPTKQFQKPVI
ncbi:unnamed protein product [Effrenium voratum]|nr:unnamed protein product [Effrenium voratum]